MLLNEIIKHPRTSLYYLERYVNDGSPSGFSKIHTTSPETSPFEISAWFHPYFCIAPIDCFRNYGTIPLYASKEFTNSDNWIMIHPDMVHKFSDLTNQLQVFESKRIRVMPTASGRTIQIINSNHQDYIKLHYEGILGRVSRELPFVKAIAGPELSKIIKEAIDRKILDMSLSLLPEIGARALIIHTKSNIFEWGMVWRENIPYGVDSDSIKYLFPSFSLFSYDSLAVHHYPLLKQIIDYTGSNPEKYIFDIILIPLIKNYFEMILKLGLQPEWNSQNLMVGFDEYFKKAIFIMRDLESIDKDISMMENLNINHNFECYPYKCIDNTQYNYKIKHSFMYDFKLGDCIIEPLLLLLEKYYKFDFEKSINKVKEIAKTYISKLPPDFFPKDKWFIFDKVLVDQSLKERPYIELNDPKFR